MEYAKKQEMHERYSYVSHANKNLHTQMCLNAQGLGLAV